VIGILRNHFGRNRGPSTQADSAGIYAGSIDSSSATVVLSHAKGAMGLPISRAIKTYFSMVHRSETTGMMPASTARPCTFGKSRVSEQWPQRDRREDECSCPREIGQVSRLNLLS